jgi:tight adherence protein C
MLIIYGVAIGAAILVLWFTVTAKPSAGRANLMAGIDLAPTKPSEPFTRRFGKVLRKLVPTSVIRWLDDLLVQAGHPQGMDLPRLLGLTACVVVVPLLFFTSLGYLLWGLVFAFVGLCGPTYWIMTERDKRQGAMRDSSADLIDQLTICVEAGLGFDAALARVAATSDGPLAAELQHATADIRAGVPRDQALKALAERSAIPEIRQLVTALVQAQRHGTPLADTLRLQAAEMRDKRAQRIEEKAAKLGTKMIFPIVVCFLPVFFIIILVPAVSGLADAFG